MYTPCINTHPSRMYSVKSSVLQSKIHSDCTCSKWIQQEYRTLLDESSDQQSILSRILFPTAASKYLWKCIPKCVGLDPGSFFTQSSPFLFTMALISCGFYICMSHDPPTKLFWVFKGSIFCFGFFQPLDELYVFYVFFLTEIWCFCTTTMEKEM